MYQVKNETSEYKDIKNSKQCLKQNSSGWEQDWCPKPQGNRANSCSPCCCNKSPSEAHGQWSQAQRQVLTFQSSSDVAYTPLQFRRDLSLIHNVNLCKFIEVLSSFLLLAAMLVIHSHHKGVHRSFLGLHFWGIEIIIVI